MKVVALILAIRLLGVVAPTQRTEAPTIAQPATQSVRFATVDVRIDPSNHPLAAYQLEVTADSASPIG